MRAFLAAQAAVRQGEEAGWRFTLALLRARHERKAELDENTIRTAVREADPADDAGLREALAADLRDSAALGVLGTPTFVLSDGNAAYLRFSRLTRDGNEALVLWTLSGEVLPSGAGIEPVRRPR